MFVTKLSIVLHRTTAALNESLQFQHVKYHTKINTVFKRGAVLKEMITNKDKRKNWHFNILSDKPKFRPLEKVHKPRRRVAVLNSLFIKNITDVLSTGDIAPEIINYGIEITGVRISPCNRLLNVFWQIPASQYNNSEEVGKCLIIAAPKIRAELVSRNVLGRVPYIFFIRDGTNEKIATYQKAMEKLDLGPDYDSSIVVDDSFTEDIYSFKEKKVGKKYHEAISVDTEGEQTTHLNSGDIKEQSEQSNNSHVYQRPLDMKCDIFGLDHAQMMDKILALRKKRKEPTKYSALITPESLLSEDIFDKIPGVRFEAGSTRDDILKQFHIGRKMLKEKKTESLSDNTSHHYEDHIENSEDNLAELNSYEEDFTYDDDDDETTKNSY